LIRQTGKKGSFLKKGLKKFKFEKRCRFGTIRKMGTSRSLIGREAWSRGPPAPPAGGRFEKYFEAPPEGLFANKKSFLFVKRSLRQASRPASGREAFRPASGREASSTASGREVPLLLIIFVIFYWNCYVVLEFMVYKLFEIQKFFKYNIYSPYSFVYI
jgi:hypothetical protein